MQDAAGNKTAPLTSTFTYDYALQKSLPEITLSSSSHPLVFFDGYNDADTHTHNYKDVQVKIVDRDKKGADKAIEIIDKSGSKDFGVTMSSQSWDTQKYNLLSFDYKIPADAVLSLRIGMWGEEFLLRLCGEGAQGDFQIPGIVADGKWHTTIFNLLSLPKKLREHQFDSIYIIGF